MEKGSSEKTYLINDIALHSDSEFSIGQNPVLVYLTSLSFLSLFEFWSSAVAKQQMSKTHRLTSGRV